MAEDEDGVSNKKSPQNAENDESAQDSEQNVTKPDLGIEEAKYNIKENGDTSPVEAKISCSKSSGAARKDGNPFSFRHFLKRDLSLPGSSTYENTGARPKIYANTVQHSPTRVDVHGDSRREKSRSIDTQAKDKGSEAGTHRSSDNNTSSSSSIEIPFSVVDNSDSKHNFYIDNNDVQFYNRPNLASEPLGMPSLPDFVQDHILVEQAYLNANGPISVDLDNLPDFTFNTNYNAGSSSLSRRNNGYSSNRGYDYETQGYAGTASTSSDTRQSSHAVPLDLPTGAEAAGLSPLDLPPHLNLDLTESVNQPDLRNPSFPLDLPSNAGAESMRLPDFLPVHPGRTSPEPEHQDEQLQQIISELERTRSELFVERSRRCRLEEEVCAARESASLVRAEAAAARAAEAALRVRLAAAGSAGGAGGAGAHYPGQQLETAADSPHCNFNDVASRATEAESTVTKLKNQIKKLKEELRGARAETQALRCTQGAAAADLRRATLLAGASLRDLLAGLEQLKDLSESLDPT